MRVAVEALTEPKRVVVVAVPTAPEKAHEWFDRVVDEFVCPLPEQDFSAAGLLYTLLDQTSDEQVCRSLQTRNG